MHEVPPAPPHTQLQATTSKYSIPNQQVLGAYPCR